MQTILTDNVPLPISAYVQHAYAQAFLVPLSLTYNYTTVLHIYIRWRNCVWDYTNEVKKTCRKTCPAIPTKFLRTVLQ